MSRIIASMLFLSAVAGPGCTKEDVCKNQKTISIFDEVEGKSHTYPAATCTGFIRCEGKAPGFIAPIEAKWVSGSVDPCIFEWKRRVYGVGNTNPRTLEGCLVDFHTEPACVTDTGIPSGGSGYPTPSPVGVGSGGDFPRNNDGAGAAGAGDDQEEGEYYAE